MPWYLRIILRGSKTIVNMNFRIPTRFQTPWIRTFREGLYATFPRVRFQVPLFSRSLEFSRSRSLFCSSLNTRRVTISTESFHNGAVIYFTRVINGFNCALILQRFHTAESEAAVNTSKLPHHRERIQIGCDDPQTRSDFDTRYRRSAYELTRAMRSIISSQPCYQTVSDFLIESRQRVRTKYACCSWPENLTVIKCDTVSLKRANERRRCKRTRAVLWFR